MKRSLMVRESEMELESLLKKAEEMRGYPVSFESFVRFLGLLLQHRGADLWELIRRSDEYIRVMMGLFEALHNEGYVETDEEGKIFFSRKGEKLVEELGVKILDKGLSVDSGKYGLSLPPRFKEILDEMRRIYTEVIPKDNFDQAPLLPEASVYKALYVAQRGDLSGKSVVTVGDDDLLSLIFGMTGEPKRVLAVDIDEQVLGVISEYSRKMGLGVDVMQSDFRLDIPPEVCGKFDTFVTEPPDTVDGITLFVSRGVQFLKKEVGKVGYCGVSTTACPPLGIVQLGKNFAEMGLVVSAWLTKFSEYPPVRTELKHIEVPDFYDPFYPPSRVWYVSDLVRLKTTNSTKPLIKGIFKGNISDYDGDAKRYR
ncbi:MAG: bis-aminopropyl spermidine synthase family protein [Planctomycetota bacterium]|nr:bis-aminopropyl spermidine synthase family protein [Planctomycetota bacterium]